MADWDYIVNQCEKSAALCNVQFLGNGDVFSWEDYKRAITPVDEGGLANPDYKVAAALLARGALIKPWLCTEIKEQRVWDISSGERLDLVKRFANYGLEHWGSDDRGVETTRRYLLEWMSFAHRYVPVGILESGYSQQMNHCPPSNMMGRNDLETLMASGNSTDWEKIVAMFLGPSPEGFVFIPKHKSKSY